MTVTAAFGPAVFSESTETAADQIALPLHQLRGEPASWANRLLRIFRGIELDGVEWSVKLSLDGVFRNRFMLGLSRAKWAALPMQMLRRELMVPEQLWLVLLDELPRCQAFYCAFEPDGRAGSYRIYLERKRQANPVHTDTDGLLGHGLKWHPLHKERQTVSRYHRLQLPDWAAVKHYVDDCFARMQDKRVAKRAGAILERAFAVAEPADLMWLDVGDDDSQRRSFAITFQGLDIPVQSCVPELVRLAHALALPVQTVLDNFHPDEPRRLASLAAGVARTGSDFMTVYYD